MLVVLQRVKCASVTVGDEEVSKIGCGLVALVGLSSDDTWADAEYSVRKTLLTKLWPDAKEPDNGWRTSVVDNSFEVLVVSQFTLFASVKKGNKPDFHAAMKNTESEAFFSRVVEQFKKEYRPEKIQSGSFGAYMNVALENDGPVTLILDSSKMQLKREPKARAPQSPPKKKTEATRSGGVQEDPQPKSE